MAIASLDVIDINLHIASNAFDLTNEILSKSLITFETWATNSQRHDKDGVWLDCRRSDQYSIDIWTMLRITGSVLPCRYSLRNLASYTKYSANLS